MGLEWLSRSTLPYVPYLFELRPERGRAFAYGASFSILTNDAVYLENKQREYCAGEKNKDNKSNNDDSENKGSDIGRTKTVEAPDWESLLLACFNARK